MPYVKFTFTCDATEISRAGAGNYRQYRLCSAALERAAMLKDKASRMATNAASYALGTDESGGAVGRRERECIAVRIRIAG
jgi:hypothetical protein